MDGQKDGHTEELKAICPFNFSKVGGIRNAEISKYISSYLQQPEVHKLIISIETFIVLIMQC